MIKRAIGGKEEGDPFANSKQIIYVLIVLAAMLWLIPVLLGINLDGSLDGESVPDYHAYAQNLVSCNDRNAGPFVGVVAGVRMCQQASADDSSTSGGDIVGSLKDVENTVRNSVIVVIDILKYIVTAAAVAIVVILRVR